MAKPTDPSPAALLCVAVFAVITIGFLRRLDGGSHARTDLIGALLGCACAVASCGVAVRTELRFLRAERPSRPGAPSWRRRHWILVSAALPAAAAAWWFIR